MMLVDKVALSIYVPLLHLTVGLTRVVNETTDVAHAVAVNDHSSLKVETVVMTCVGVLRTHA